MPIGYSRSIRPYIYFSFTFVQKDSDISYIMSFNSSGTAMESQ